MSIRPLLIAGLLIATPMFALQGFAEDQMTTDEAAAEAPAAADALPTAEIKKIIALFEAGNDALLDGDLEKWQSYWTEDAVLMPPDHPTVKGHKALIAFAKKNLDKIEDIKLSEWTIEGRRDLAVVTTAIEWRFKGGEALTAKQLVIVKKNASGAWKAQKVIYNSDGKSKS